MITTQEIKREMLLKASREKVWAALTTAEGWTGWFSQGVEGEFQVGNTLTLNFGEHGLCWGIVVEREEMQAFSYKWHPGEDCELDKYPESEMTTVRFNLSDHDGGTLLTLVESGFENISEPRGSRCVELNSKGWAWELEELQAWVEQDIRQSKGDSSSCSS